MEGPQWTAQLTGAPDNQSQTAGDFYLAHPDGRVVAAFFLGCVFMHGLHYSVSSSFVRSILRRFRAAVRLCLLPLRPKRVRVDPEIPHNMSLSEKGVYSRRRPSDAVETRSIQERNDHGALVFVLNLCLMFAAFAQFLTLLTFGNGWETGCTFVVAWGGMSAQMARLLGMLILIIELTVLLDMRRRTVWFLRGMLVIALVFVFASNATNTGITSTPNGARTSFCYRQHFLPTSLVSSIIHLVMELYLAIRVIKVLLSSRRLFDDISSSCPLVRVLSLFILDILTVVPDAVATNIFAQFIPFTVGAVLVLATFNWRPRSSSIRSPVQSLIVVNRPPATADPLLVPTPFTLHFPREFRDDHSWCSDSQHSAPRSVQEGDAVLTTASPSVLTNNTAEAVSTRNVENAVITTASQAWRRSVRQVSLPSAVARPEYPQSAPAQLLVFGNPGHGPPRKILDSQVEVAARLEQQRLGEWRQRVPSGLALPPSHSRSRSEVIVHDDDASVYSDDNEHDLPQPTPNSAIFGSDILRRTSGRRRDQGDPIRPSPAPTQTSFVLSPDDSRRTTYRYSYNSNITTRSSDESVTGSLEDGTRPSPASRASKRRGFLSPTDSFIKSPWRTISRYSLASVRSRPARDELPTVRESSPAPGPDNGVGQDPPRRQSQRRTFGQSSLSSKRGNRPSLLAAFPPLPEPPMPPLPALLPTPQGVSPFPNLLPEEPLPTVTVCPATPEPGYVSAQPLSGSAVRSPPWLTRSIRPTSVVRGPRPLPTASITMQDLASGWPGSLQNDGNLDTRGLSRESSRSRRYSCPSLYSSDSLSRSGSDRRPSV